MRLRLTMRLLAAGALLLASLSFGEKRAGSAERAAGPRPNIVVILADDLGFHDVGFTGGVTIRTPNLDSLAMAGARLNHFYVQPLCTPTRAALLTGRYPIRHGLQVGVVRPWAQYGLPLEERTLPQALKEAGYVTAIHGKWHLGHFRPEYLPTRRGFDFQYGHYNGAIDYYTHDRDGGHDWHRDDKASRDEGYGTHLIARESVRRIREHDTKKPLFLYVAFSAPHAPHQVPERYKEPYRALKEPRRTYAGMVAAMDEAVGQIVAALDNKGIRDNTLIIFSSDNGGPNPGRVSFNGPLRGDKGTVYQGGVRVPAFANWKGRIRPWLRDEPIHMVDWYPTLLKLAGASLKQKLPIDGLDVWSTITEGAPSPHDAILINAAPRSGAIRSGDWKLVIQNGSDDPDGNPGADSAESVELFNLRNDQSESRDLSSENPDIVKRLRARYEALKSQATPPKSRPKPRGFVSPKVWGEP